MNTEKFTSIAILKTTHKKLNRICEIQRRKLYDVIDIIISEHLEWIENPFKKAMKEKGKK